MPSRDAFRPGPEALAGRTILVNGAHGALGSAAASACAAAGATVVLLGRRVPKLGRLYDAIEQSGAPQPAIYPLDLEGATPDDFAQLAIALEAQCGHLDGILHCAAEFKGLASIENCAPADLLRALHVNLVAPMLLTRALLPLLRQREDAAVVFAMDDPARVARAFWGGYAIAQHGLEGLLAVLHDECENSSVRIHGLRPGPMRTPLRARAYFAEDPRILPDAASVAPACVHLLSAAGASERGRVLTLDPVA
jgi:NAD(P)-dependent dehydrogenase (short-subunit alcohol dehydrogenase family)